MSEVKDGYLAKVPHWSVTAIESPTSFFEGIERVLPEATTLFVEGGGVEKDVIGLLERHAEPGPFIPARGTLWPRTRYFRAKVSPVLLRGLAALAKRHAVPELCDHLHLYDGDHALAEWYDAFVDPLLLTEAVPEARVRQLCEITLASYKRVPM